MLFTRAGIWELGKEEYFANEVDKLKGKENLMRCVLVQLCACHHSGIKDGAMLRI